MIYLVIIIVIIALFVIFEIFVLKSNLKLGGKIVITKNEVGRKLFSLELDADPDEIEKMNFILFKVVKEATKDLD
jgi:hypothetical protein